MWKCNSCGSTFKDDVIPKKVDLGNCTLNLCYDCSRRMDYLLGDDKVVNKF